MYTLLRSVPLRQAVAREAPPVTVAMATAEMFYHFHSFTLECLAFLPTWYLASRAYVWLRGSVGPRAEVSRS
jgi:hypothetical protein